MDFVKFSIQKPVTVIVGVILVVLFGAIGLHRMPYQLSPTVIEPEISVNTIWPGATPYEIEREIIEVIRAGRDVVGVVAFQQEVPTGVQRTLPIVALWN